MGTFCSQISLDFIVHININNWCDQILFCIIYIKHYWVLMLLQKCVLQPLLPLHAHKHPFNLLFTHDWTCWYCYWYSIESIPCHLRVEHPLIDALRHPLIEPKNNNKGLKINDYPRINSLEIATRRKYHLNCKGISIFIHHKISDKKIKMYIL